MATQRDTKFLHLRLVRENTVARTVSALAFVILFGTCGFMWIEQWDLWRSLFFTLITLTTVGYGDYGLSPVGEKFTTILLIGGIGVVTYCAGQLMPIIMDPELARRRRMNKQISLLQNHFIVCGLGRIGREVCDRLEAAGETFVAIDADPDSVKWATDLDYLAVMGDAAADEVLLKANIKHARGIACLTPSDTENIVITLTARELNEDVFIIARAEHNDAVRKIQRAGASRVISPIRSGGVTIANTILKPHLAHILEQNEEMNESFCLGEIVISRESSLNGRSFHDFSEANPHVVLIAHKAGTGEMQIRPSENESMNDGDILIVAGKASEVGRLRALNLESAAAA